MAFFAQTGPNAQARLAQLMGQSLGQGAASAIGQGIANQKQFQQQSALANMIFGQGSQQAQEFSQLPPDVQLEYAKLMQPKAPAGGLTGQATPPEVGQAISQVMNANKEADADTLAMKMDEAGIPRAFSNSYIENRRQTTKPVFEPTSEKLEAERVAKYADTLENDFLAAKNENLRLDRMDELSKSDKVSTPLMIKSLEKLGLPIGILSNPNTEEFRKLETDFIRDAKYIFPGGRITDYDIKSFLQTVPTLMNSPEGRERIIQNRRLMNEAKLIKYNEYKKILKENNGRKPPNLFIQLEERVQPQIQKLEDDFSQGIDDVIQQYQTPIRMIAPDGKPVNIPPNKIQDAINAGAKFG